MMENDKFKSEQLKKLNSYTEIPFDLQEDKNKIADKELNKISGGFKKIDYLDKTEIEKFKDEIIKIHNILQKNR